MATGNKTGERRAAGKEPAPPPPVARTQRAKHILDTAAVLLVRWGFRKTTVDDVARAAGVAKGTIYLHWKDKNELFRAALMHAQEQVNAEMRQRIAADPEGGLPHRLWTHGMLTALGNPLTAAVLQGRTDLFQGLRGAFEPATVQQMLGDYETYIVQMQEAGLIRADLPVSIITFVTSALKIGVINTPDFFGPGQTPPLEELTEVISDLIRRWLEPDRSSGDQEAGKRFAAEWLEKLQEIEQDLQQTEQAS